MQAPVTSTPGSVTPDSEVRVYRGCQGKCCCSRKALGSSLRTARHGSPVPQGA